MDTGDPLAKVSVDRDCESTGNSRSVSRGRAWLVLSVLWLLVAGFSIWYIAGSTRYSHIDFVAFYCGGEVVAQHADPYREMPLNACEHAITSGGLYASSVTVPAPLPPYALLPFALLSRVPFDAAYATFAGLLACALVAGTLLLRAMRVTPMLTIAAVAYPAVDSIRQGQPVLIVFLAIVLTGWALARGNVRLAAICSLATFIEPHIGAPVALALFLWRPGTRLILAAGAVTMAALSIVAVGFPTTLEYVTAVVPLHAASEAHWVTQLSFTYALTLFGTPTHVALELAAIQYAGTVFIGVYVAGRTAIAHRAPEMVALLPPLFATLGGPFIHAGLLLVALPAALVIASRTGRASAYLCLGAVAIVWLFVSDPVDFVLSIVSAATIAYMWRSNALIAVLAALCIASIGIAHYPLQGAVRLAPAGLHIDPSAFAEQSWGQFIDAVNPARHAQFVALVLKVPTWVGLLCLCRLSMNLLARGRVPLESAG